MSMSVTCPRAMVEGWCNMKREFGSVRRRPFGAARTTSTAAEATSPFATVRIGTGVQRNRSYIAKPASADPPGEFTSTVTGFAGSLRSMIARDTASFR